MRPWEDVHPRLLCCRRRLAAGPVVDAWQFLGEVWRGAAGQLTHAAGTTNAQGEEQIPLDVAANAAMTDALARSGAVAALASEEEPEPLALPHAVVVLLLPRLLPAPNGDGDALEPPPLAAAVALVLGAAPLDAARVRASYAAK